MRHTYPTPIVLIVLLALAGCGRGGPGCCSGGDGGGDGAVTPEMPAWILRGDITDD